MLTDKEKAIAEQLIVEQSNNLNRFYSDTKAIRHLLATVRSLPNLTTSICEICDKEIRGPGLNLFFGFAHVDCTLNMIENPEWQAHLIFKST